MQVTFTLEITPVCCESYSECEINYRLNGTKYEIQAEDKYVTVALEGLPPGKTSIKAYTTTDVEDVEWTKWMALHETVNILECTRCPAKVPAPRTNGAVSNGWNQQGLSVLGMCLW